MRVRRSMAAGLAAVTLLGLVACGDDDDATTGASDTTVAAGDDTGFEVDPEHQEYCDVSAELDEGDDFPTEEQLRDLQEVSPPEIQAEIDVVVEALIADGPAAFGDPEVNQAFEVIEGWEVEHCGREPEEEAEPQEPEEGAARVELTATEYAFDVPDSIDAGRTALVMTNDGEENHHLDVVRFKEGTTREEAEAAAEEGPEALMGLIDEDADLGGPTESSLAAPGEQAVLNLDLEAGLYGIGCFVSAPDGQPHFFKGMFAIFEAE